MDLSVLQYYTSMVNRRIRPSESSSSPTSTISEYLDVLQQHLIYQTVCHRHLNTISELLKDTATVFESSSLPSPFQKLKLWWRTSTQNNSLTSRFEFVITLLKNDNETEENNEPLHLDILFDTQQIAPNMISAPSFPYLPSATQKLSVPDHQLSSPISSSLTTNKPLKVDHLHETSKDSCDDTSSINSLYDDLTCSPCFIDAEPPSEQPISPPLIHTDTVQALSQSTPPQQVQEPPLTMEEHTISLVKQELLPSDVVVLEGFLSFRGQIVPQFRSRYALLTQNRLLYFPLNEPISSKLVRCIDLTDASVLSGSDGQSVNIVLSTPHSVHNIYRIKAENGAIAAKWTNALSSLLSPPEAS